MRSRNVLCFTNAKFFPKNFGIEFIIAELSPNEATNFQSEKIFTHSQTLRQKNLGAEGGRFF